MAEQYEEVGKLEQYPIHDFKRQAVLTGTFKQFRSIPFEDGDRVIYDFDVGVVDKESNSTWRSIWGTTVLKRMMDKVNLNDKVRITSLGQVLKSKKGQKAYNWKVERAIR